MAKNWPRENTRSAKKRRPVSLSCDLPTSIRLAELLWGRVRGRQVAQTFQSAVSPISNRQGIDKRNALVNSWRSQVANVANLRYGRLESLRYFGCGVSRARFIRGCVSSLTYASA